MAKSQKQRALSRERLERMTETGSYSQQVTQTPTPATTFDAAYARSSGPEAALWDDRGIMHWRLPTCSAR